MFNILYRSYFNIMVNPVLAILGGWLITISGGAVANKALKVKTDITRITGEISSVTETVNSVTPGLVASTTTSLSAPGQHGDLLRRIVDVLALQTEHRRKTSLVPMLLHVTHRRNVVVGGISIIAIVVGSILLARWRSGQKK